MSRASMAAWVALIVSACGGARLSPSATAGESIWAEDGSVEPLRTERQLAFEEYDALLTYESEIEALASAHDCGSACAGGARLCDLSERICAIADELPGDGELEARCADGRERCARARARVSAICGCEDD